VGLGSEEESASLFSVCAVKKQKWGFRKKNMHFTLLSVALKKANNNNNNNREMTSTTNTR